VDSDSYFLKTNKLLDIILNNNIKLDNKKIQKKIDKMVKDKINLIKSVDAKAIPNVKGGYKSYDNRTVLGDLMTLLTENRLNDVLVNKLFVQFKKNRGYTLLFQLDYITNGRVSGLTPMKFMYVTYDTNVKLISVNVINGLNKVRNEYNVDADICRLSVIWRDWLSNMDYSKLVDPALRKDIVEEVLRDQAKDYLSSQSKLDKVLKFLKIGNFNNYVKDFPYFDSITMLDVYNNTELSEFIKDELGSNLKVTLYKSTNFSKGNELYFVFYISTNTRVLCIGDSKSRRNTLTFWNKDKYP
jgi:hypothetical protein